MSNLVPKFESKKNRLDGGEAEVSLEMWGIRVSPTSSDEVIQWISDQMDSGKRLLVGHNLHSVYLYLTDQKFRSVYDSSDLVIIDGFPILLLCNAKRAFRRQRVIARSKRCGSTDWLPKISKLAPGRRIAVIGSTNSSNLKAVAYLQSLAPHLEFRGWNGFEDLSLLRSSNFLSLKQFQPDLVLFGLGMPFQEQILSDSRDVLPDALYAAVGGAIDQFSGAQRNAPRFLGPLGLEWLWRLMMNPRRLAGRYLIEPLKLIFLTFRIQFQDLPSSRISSSREVL